MCLSTPGPNAGQQVSARKREKGRKAACSAVASLECAGDAEDGENNLRACAQRVLYIRSHYSEGAMEEELRHCWDPLRKKRATNYNSGHAIDCTSISEILKYGGEV